MHSNRRRRWLLLPLTALSALVLSGCNEAEQRGYLPGSAGTTNHTDGIVSLWVNSWIVLLIVGIVTWSLIIWCCIAYRRRKSDTGLPVQLRYNMPIEIFYTVIPLLLVVGFFAFTAREQSSIEAKYAPEDVDVNIEAYGKQWSWDFNYLDTDSSAYPANAWVSGVQARQLPDDPGSVDEAALPTLYLPVNARVQIDLKSRDVIHSFWVPEFLYKKDMIPGHDNVMSFVPQTEGEYIGKCAELCGEYHSMMLFKVKVVSADEYRAYINDLKANGHEGRRGDEYNRNQNQPGNSAGDSEDEEEKAKASN